MFRRTLERRRVFNFMAESLLEKIGSKLPGQIVEKKAAVPPWQQPGRKWGRPVGSKTRPDAPSKLKRAAQTSQAVPPDNQTPPISQTPPPTGALPDSVLFGTVPPPDDGSPPDENEFPPEDEAKTSDADPEVHRAFAVMIFDSVTGIFAAIIGVFWLPRKVGKNAEAGEIPYDEKEMVVIAVCKYFASIGMAILTPAQEMYMAIFAYCAPRLNLTFQWIRLKFMKKAKPAPTEQTPPTPDTRMPQDKPPETEKKDAPAHNPTQLDHL